MLAPLWGANVMSAASADNEGTLAWSAGGQSSAVANSTTTANSGTQSVRCTRGTGTGALCVNNNTEIPVAANTAYYVAGWVFTNGTGLTLNLNVEWYTSAQAFINSTLTPTISVPQNTWTPYDAAAFTTGASSAFLRINPQRVAGLATGDFVYFDTFSVARLLGYANVPTPNLNAVRRAATW